MKNTKKLLTILSLSAITLLGCGNDDTVESTETPVEETADVENNDVSENPAPNDGEDAEVITSDLGFFVVHNHEIYPTYIANSGHDASEFNFDEIQTFEEMKTMRQPIQELNDELRPLIDDKLADNPYIITNAKNSNGKTVQYTKLRQRLGQIKRDILDANRDPNASHIFIINKRIDDYVSTHYAENGAVNIVDTFNQYEENITNATSTTEMNKTIFENDEYLVHLAPNYEVLRFDQGDTDTEQAIDNLNRFAEYFETDDVQDLFETYLGK